MFQKWDSIFPWKMQALATVHGTQQWTPRMEHVPLQLATVPTVYPCIHNSHQPRLYSNRSLPQNWLWLFHAAKPSMNPCPHQDSGYSVYSGIQGSQPATVLFAPSSHLTPVVETVLSVQYSAHCLAFRLLNPQSPQLGRPCSCPQPWPSGKL